MRIRRAVIATAAALTVLAGCGSDSDDTSSDDPAFETTEPAEPVELPGEPGDRFTEATFASSASQAQTDARSAHVEVEAKMMGQEIVMSGDLMVGETLADTAFAMEMAAPVVGEDVSVILVDEVLYIRDSTTGDKYLRMPLDGDNPIGAFYTQFLGQSDPAGIIRAFDGAIEDFEKVGTESIDGTATTQYRVKVETRKVLGSILGEAPMSASWAEGVPKTLTYDIWVGDEDSLPRRMVFSVMGTKVSMTLSDWGEPVDIAAPPASEISDEDPYAPSPTP
jgi:hypothetical protein